MSEEYKPLFVTTDESGKPLIDHHESCNCPSDYTFDCINNFVNSPDVGFEDLQYLCLGMSNYIESLEKKIDRS